MRKSVALPLILAVFLSGPALAQEAAGAADQADPRCQSVVCRKPGRSQLQLSEGGSGSLPKPPIPYFTGSVLSLVPGDTIVLGFTRTPEGLSAPVLVEVKDEHGAVDIGARPTPELTVSFSLKQQPDKPGMMLTVVNNTHLMVKYDAHMYVPSAGKVSSSSTSSCPVMPMLSPGNGFTVFEAWPHPIALMLIGQVRILTPDATAGCY